MHRRKRIMAFGRERGDGASALPKFLYQGVVFGREEPNGPPATFDLCRSESSVNAPVAPVRRPTDRRPLKSCTPVRRK
jgi:hypothetical protein